MAQSRSGEEKKTCKLLAVPAEMKNIIYRYTLVGQNDITVSATTQPAEPGLLSTCREIRKDASQIYYQENDFVFCIMDLDNSTFIKWKVPGYGQPMAHDKPLDSTVAHLLGIVKDSGREGGGKDWSEVSKVLEHVRAILVASDVEWA